MTRPSRRVRFAVACFTLVSRLLPAGLRRGALGEDMRATFRDEALEACRLGGTPALVRTTAGAMLDVLSSALPGRHRSPNVQGRTERPDSNTAILTPRQKRVFMAGLWHDIRYAVRILRRRPGFVLVAGATLAVGIGANSAIFTIVDAAFLRPLPYRHADRLVRVWGRDTIAGNTRGNLNPVDAADWRRQVPAFSALGVWTKTTAPLTGAGDPTLVRGALVSSGFFEALGVTPAAGRLFGPEHDRPGHETDIVISYGFWQRVLGGQPAVGRTVTLAGVACTIIGVLPRGFVSPGISAGDEPEIWRPYAVAPDATRGGHFMHGLARLAPGATLDEAQAQIDAVSATLAREHPATNAGKGAILEPLQQAISGDARPALVLLMAAVGVVLLIACANAANLLLVHAGARQHEMALRAALGAGRARVVRELLVEGLLIAALAGAAGLGLAVYGLRALPAWMTEELPTVLALRVDGSVVLFTMVVALATILVFGLAPALQVARANLRGPLTATRAAGPRGPRRLQTLLLVFETALALLLFVSATLLIESFVRLRDVDPGFDAARVTTFHVSLPRARYATPDARRHFFDGLLDRIAALPGVTATGAINMAPLTGRYSCDSFGLADRPAPPEGHEPCAESCIATPGYFRTMGIPIVEGRGLAGTDVAGREPVLVISQAMASHYWPDGGAVGQRLKWGSVASEGPWWTIVGVAGNVRHFRLDVAAPDQVYMPQAQWSTSSMTITARTGGDPAVLTGELRHAVEDLDPALPVSEVFSGRDLVDRSTAMPEFLTQLTVAFAAVALGLAMVGVYGLMSFFVAQRTREIGIRMALGARAREVRRMVVRRGMVAVAIGVVCGLTAALGFTRLLETLLYGVTPTDWHAFAVAAAALFATAFAAAYLPARRATRVDPLAVMRAE